MELFGAHIRKDFLQAPVTLALEFSITVGVNETALMLFTAPTLSKLSKDAEHLCIE